MVASALSSPSRGLVVYRRHEPEKLVLSLALRRGARPARARSPQGGAIS